MPSKTILIKSEGLGTGEEKLGAILMTNFLRMLGESQDKPGKLIFWNAGVRLVCAGSKVLEYLKRLEGQGVTILACSTCLEYLELSEKIAVGKPTTMAQSIATMFNSDMICL